MAERSLGMPAITTCSAAPAAKSAAAVWVIAHGRAGEGGVEAGDRLHQQRLVVAGRPVERVEGDAAVDPAGRVAGVERVGQGRHQVFADAGGLAREGDVVGAVVLGQVDGRKAADEELGQSIGGQGLEERPGALDESESDLVGDDFAVEQPCPRFRLGDGVGQHLVQLEDLHAVGAQIVDEGGVIAFGVLDPQHVVEEQFVGVRRGEPVVGEAGGGHEHPSQLPDLRVHAEIRVCHVSPFFSPACLSGRLDAPVRSGSSPPRAQRSR
jgi:hypothetical protein